MKLNFDCILKHLKDMNILKSTDEPVYLSSDTYEVLCFVNKTPKGTMKYFVKIVNEIPTIHSHSLANFARHYNFDIANILKNCSIAAA